MGLNQRHQNQNLRGEVQEILLYVIYVVLGRLVGQCNTDSFWPVGAVSMSLHVVIYNFIMFPTMFGMLGCMCFLEKRASSASKS